MTAPFVTDSFKRIALDGWRQFADLQIEFDQQLTVLTGANATGKSTILTVLARHFDWGRAFSTSPGTLKSRSQAWSSLARRRARMASKRGVAQEQIGTLTYATGKRTGISVPVENSNSRSQYDLMIAYQQPVVGLFLSSHRMSAGGYTAVPSVPTVATVEQLYAALDVELRNRWVGNSSNRSPQLALKEGLIIAAILGGKSSNVQANFELQQLWDSYQYVLHAVMPRDLGYRRLSISLPEVIIETDTGNFILDEASGGLSSIIELTWQIFLRSWNQPNFVVLIDEPENHLHPSLQREIIPRLLNAFPSVQFIVATHSPFVVSASANGSVYALDRYANEGAVSARQLDFINRAASADRILQQVLGLETTFPIWATARFDEIVNRHMRGSMTVDAMSALRNDLETAGLIDQYSRAVVDLADNALQYDRDRRLR